MTGLGASLSNRPPMRNGRETAVPRMKYQQQATRTGHWDQDDQQMMRRGSPRIRRLATGMELMMEKGSFWPPFFRLVARQPRKTFCAEMPPATCPRMPICGVQLAQVVRDRRIHSCSIFTVPRFQHPPRTAHCGLASIQLFVAESGRARPNNPTATPTGQAQRTRMPVPRAGRSQARR